jgi:ABC-type branched-subunit amino acid transport system ATPase component/branched-subunit amino acid ABC-type transport system permease component
MSTVIVFLLLGAATGALYVLAALGLVVTYRGSGVLNFATGAIGMVGAFVYYSLSHAGAPTALALIVGVVASAGLSLVTRGLMTRMTNPSPLTLAILTFAVLIVLQSAIGLIYNSGTSYAAPSLLPTGGVHLFSGIIVGADRLILIGVACLVTLLGYWIYRHTRFGLATTAVAEDALVLQTHGWSPELIATANWALGGALAGFASILLAPITGLSADLATVLLVPTLAAAVIGNLRSFPMVLVGGLIIGAAQAEVQNYVSVAGMSDVVPFVAIMLALILSGGGLPNRDTVAQRLPRVTSGRIRPVALVLLAAAGAVVIWLLLSAVWVNALTFTLITVILGLSIVVITGLSGQISLAQWALSGAAGLLCATLVHKGLGWELASLITLVASVPVGLIVGAGVLRTRGMSLAVATLAFGVCLISVVLGNLSLNGGETGIAVGTPRLFGLDLSPQVYPQRFASFAAIVCIVIGLVILNIRRGESGRRLLAVRANERAAAGLGINVTAAKMVGFSYGVMIAAAAGILTVMLFPYAEFTNYNVLGSITPVANTVVGGVGFVSGSVVAGIGVSGGLLDQALSGFGNNSLVIVQLILGVCTILAILGAPDGLVPLNAELLRRVTAALWDRDAPQTLESALDVPPPSRTDQHQVLEGHQVAVSYGVVKAVNGIDFTLSQGKVLGVIGPNGAGKTTLIDAITGFTRLSGGEVLLAGRDISRTSVHERARLGLVRSFQSLELFEDLTVYENLAAACEKRSALTWITDAVRPGKASLNAVAVAAVRELGLDDVLHAYPGELSYGRRRLVAIARAVSSDPKFLLLDEPAAGLDETERRELGALIRRLADRSHIGILLVEHDVSLVMAVSDDVLALNFGQRLTSGAPEVVRKDPLVAEAYLGEAPAETTDGRATPVNIDV